MLRRFSINFALFSMGLDALIIELSLILVTRIRPLLSNLPYVKNMIDPIKPPWFFYLLFPITWVGILLLLSVYDGRKNLRVTDEITSLIFASILAGVSIAGTLYLSYRELSRAVFLILFAVAFVIMIFWRLAFRLAYSQSTHKLVSQRRVLIVGAGEVGRRVQDQIHYNPFFGLNLVGFLDDSYHKRLQNKDILGSIEEARRIVRLHKIDDIVIALPRRAHEKVNLLVAELHTLPIKVWIIPDYFGLALHKAVVEDFAGMPMFDLRAPALNEYQRLMKRAFDLFLTAILFIPAIILMTIISIAIRFEGPGPILFRQQRVGENGHLFQMYKFRTMVPNAEQLRHLVEYHDNQGHLIHKSNADPRVTGVGKFLRRTSLDELPQLFNILRGEMSLVGPRPELPYLVAQYEPWQHKRFAVPQGITGWWQVNGRSDKPMHLNTEDDLYYVQNYSLLLDVQILFKTINIVFRGKGAF